MFLYALVLKPASFQSVSFVTKVLFCFVSTYFQSREKLSSLSKPIIKNLFRYVYPEELGFTQVFHHDSLSEAAMRPNNLGTSMVNMVHF